LGIPDCRFCVSTGEDRRQNRMFRKGNKRPINDHSTDKRNIKGEGVVSLNDEALYKGVYLAVMEVIKKWTGRIRDWHLIIAELAVYFKDRLGGYL